MNEIMIDCETLGTGECPVILTMGAMIFNHHDIVAAKYWRIDLKTCQELGFQVDERTVLWWQDQSKEAVMEVTGGETHIKKALEELIQFYKKHDCRTVWSNGAIADIRWLNNGFIKVGLASPWKFWQERCFRTIRECFPKIKDFKKHGVAHHALDDARNQVRYLIALRKKYFLDIVQVAKEAV